MNNPSMQMKMRLCETTCTRDSTPKMERKMKPLLHKNMLILGMLLMILLAQGTTAETTSSVSTEAQENGIQRPSGEVIQEIKHLLLNKIGVTSPPPPTDSASGPSMMSNEEAKDYSIRNWRRNTRADKAELEEVRSTVLAQVAHKGKIISLTYLSNSTFPTGYILTGLYSLNCMYHPL